MDKELSEKEFLNIKKQILESPDASKKGYIDSFIVNFMHILNNEKDYVTKSSCSGRIVLISANLGSPKNECKTWYQTHEYASKEELKDKLQIAKGHLLLKFEPFVLHVQCRTLQAAKKLFDIARDAGYKDSGLVIGKHGKVTLAVRNKNNLEVPISNGKEIIVTDSFMEYCIDLANSKMTINFEQIKLFENAISAFVKNNEN